MPPTNSYLDPSMQHESAINWSIIILIFAGILTIIVLITVFFVIPNYAEKFLEDRVQDGINNLPG